MQLNGIGCPILAAVLSRQAGGPGERFMIAGVERGVSFAVANDRTPRLTYGCPIHRSLTAMSGVQS